VEIPPGGTCSTSLTNLEIREIEMIDNNEGSKSIED